LRVRGNIDLLHYDAVGCDPLDSALPPPEYRQHWVGRNRANSLAQIEILIGRRTVGREGVYSFRGRADLSAVRQAIVRQKGEAGNSECGYHAK
jgi:hypothetical protein